METAMLVWDSVTHALASEDQCPTLNCNHEQPILAFQTRCSRNGRGMPAPTATAPTATALTSAERGSHADTKPHVFGPALAPRRLTPRECERLQGFPDHYTLLPGASDSRRYRALGNSMAVPVMAWIGRRIQAVDDLTPQTGL
jgi:DNA (cytosine-5)-methyltransferase 1